MATTVLRQLLQSFCTNSPWTYVVLWKLRHHSPMSLTWEDGYCIYPIPRESVESISSDVYSKGEIIPSHIETSIDGSCFGGYPIGLVVANMSNLKYAWGEGVVGKVAFTEKHCWVSCDDIFTGKANSKLVPECPEEWLLQFASGFKSILLVPVLPHGVLQLGSLEMVAEDLSIPAYIKDRFAYIHAQLPSLLISSLLENLEESSSASISPLNSEDSNAVDSVKPNKLLALNRTVPLLSIENSFQVPGTDLPEDLGSESENKRTVPPVNLSEVSSPLCQSISSNQLAMGESELFGLFCLKEELQVYPECNTNTVGEYGEILDGIKNDYPPRDFLAPPFGDYNVDDAGFLSFPKHCELHKALGPAFQRQSNQYLCQSSFLSEEIFRDLFDGIESPLSAKVGDAEYLLQAVVGQIYDNSVDIANRSNHVMTSTGQLPSQPQSVKDDSTLSSRFTSAFVGGANSSSKISASSQSTVSMLTDNQNPGKGCYYTRSRKGQKKSSITKRKARPGDNPTPKPRDRQMIQDRLKELRELVPNGAKYSIDALLDQTINHMLYLRSVTNQAEKLRQWVHREVTVRKNVRSSEIKIDYQNGKSWAFEIGDELNVCPIIVEDLAYPGHLLIEMLCNEHSLFLEIAQVIRNFNLTILKGVMESCSNNTWAHFIVEASRAFHRLDIFWPLMQLLQRQRNPISSKDSIMKNSLSCFYAS